MRIRALINAMILALLIVVPLWADEKKEQQDETLLTLDRIFSSTELKGDELGTVRWLKKNAGYVVLEDSEQHKGASDVVHYEPKSGKRTVLLAAGHLIPDGESSPLTIEDFEFSPNEALLLIYTNSKRVWRRNTRGDYWVVDLTSGGMHKLGGDAKPSTLMFAKFSPKNDRVAFVRDRNVYVEDLTTKRIWPVTKTKSDTIINGTFDWVYEEELGLRDGYRWSPDAKKIAFWHMDTTGVGTFHLVKTTDGVYTKLTPIKYPKVGTTNSACQIGIVSVDADEYDPAWIDLGDDTRNNYVARMDWVPDKDEILLQRLNRRQNANTVYLVDLVMREATEGSSVETRLKSGPRIIEATKTFVDKDDAWVDVYDHLTWINKGKEFTWISERDGWRRVYWISKDGKEIKPVTPARMDVIDVLHVDVNGGQVYYLASPDNATQQYLYRSTLDGTDYERVTPRDNAGWNTYRISPDAKWAMHVHSSFDQPPVTTLIELAGHKEIRTLKANKDLHEKVQKLKRKPVEFFRVDAGNLTLLDGWCMKPDDFDPMKKYPLLMYVYGEPAGQTVLDRWSADRYLWHLLLTQKGYVVMSVDNRGTPAPKGSAWRKVVYRKLCAMAAKEQAGAVKSILKERDYLDPKRVGSWGWSGGGTMSLHALFRFPDVYSMAMSIAPVTNERYYDTIYSERYMGLPHDNVKGYRENSPIHYAHQLKGKLLLVHGTADDNVHYQNTEALINELIRHNKQFDMMSYPNRTHSIREGKNTRRHLFGLLTRYLERNLPVK